MNHDEQQEIVNHEATLASAMLNSDIKILDELISSDLLFTNHLGQLMTKQQDLDAHKSGLLRINTLEISEQKIIMQSNIAIVSVRTRISGIFHNQPASGEFRFTRVWSRTSATSWEIIGGHSSVIQ